MSFEFSSDHILEAYQRLNELNWGGKKIKKFDDRDEEENDPDDLKGLFERQGFEEEND